MSFLSFFSKSNQVGNSARMELEGFVKCLKFLKEVGVKVGAIVTDRHPSVQKYMREKQAGIVHYYDTWHVAKGTFPFFYGIVKSNT